MAFQGQLYSVSFENYKQLAYLGVDVICVEKEGIVDKLVPFTTDFGIALVQSEGFLSEYGQMLAQEADKTGANVIMLTDFDSGGIELAYKIKGMKIF
jgi:DNA topoisomerase VI subunit A